MTKHKRTISLLVVAGLAASALGQNNGDIIFTNQTDDTIKLLSGGSLTTLVSFADPSVRLAGITRASNGRWYVANGPAPHTNNSAQILEIDDLFAAIPNVSVLAQGDPIQNPIGLRWDAGRGVLIGVNNPGNFPLVDRNDGIQAYGLGGAVTQVWSEDLSIPNPRYADGVWLTKMKDGSEDYLVVARNGGAFGGGPDATSSTFWRLSIDGSLNGTMNFLADLGDAAGLGLSEGIFEAQGITTTDNGRIFMASRDNGKIYEVDLSSGVSLVEIASGIDFAHRIEYNRYTNKLVIAQQDTATNFGRIAELNLDGTGYNILTDDPIVSARDLYIIPTPGTLALLSLGGLAMNRRRR